MQEPKKARKSGMALFCQQFLALVKKNFLLKAREWKSTLMEIAIPIGILALLVLMRALISASEKDADLNLQHMSTMHSPSQPQNIGFWLNRVQDENWRIAMMPDDSSTRGLEAFLLDQQLGFRPADFEYFESSQAFKDYVSSDVYPKTRGFAYMGVDIRQWDVSTGLFEYAIRANTSSDTRTVPQMKPYLDTIRLGLELGNYNIYKNDGALDLQLLVDEFIMNQTAELAGVSFERPQIDITPFPTPKHRDDVFASALGEQLTFLWVLAFIWPVTKLTKLLVEEKEKRIKEGMKMMGLSETALWCSWFFTYALIYIVVAALSCWMFSASVFEFADAGVVFVWLFLYQMTLLALCFLVASLFTRARTASTFSALIYLGLYFITLSFNDDSSSGTKSGAALFSSPVGLSLGAAVLSQYESNAQGITWGRMSSEYDDWNMGSCFGMFIANIVIYLVLALYLNQVVPNEGGVRRPVYFCCLPSFWCRSLRRYQALPAHHPEDNTDPKMIEAGPEDGVVGVKVENLRKVFSRSGPAGDLIAVNNVNLDLYEGQILSLLGHNGAGKTTTISMLNGLLAPTSGNATFYGKSLHTDMDEIRRDLGVCPQHDILFDNLSVKEHLEMYAAIKGMMADEIPAVVEEMIKLVGLTEKVNTRSGSLSGGQKRKLSVGIALLGDNKVVFLDEPTSGMDPYSRRWTWNLLKQRKKGRVIILTTHFMDEADQLGDRIAIMARGQIQCCGSSLFLKDKYGVGYTLTIVKKHKNVVGLDEVVKKHVPQAEVMSNVASEVGFRLPLAAADRFPALFEELDARQEELGVDSYGISVTTLEEVFLRVGHAAGKTIETQGEHKEMKEKEKEKDGKGSASSKHTIVDVKPKDGQSDVGNEIFETRMPERTPGEIFRTHFRALFIKRFQNALKDRKMLMWQIVYPALIMLVGIGLLKSASFSKDPDPFALNTAQFNNVMDGKSLLYPYGGVGFNVGDLAAALETPNNIFDLRPTQLSGTNVTEFSQSLLDTFITDSPRYIAMFAEDNGVAGMRYVAYTNTTATHGLPTSMAYMSLARLRDFRQQNGLAVTDDNRIHAFIHPMPLTAEMKTLMDATAGIIISIAFAFIPAAVVMFVVKERETKVKHQQVISGVSTHAYWVSTLAFDAMNFIIPIILALIIIAAFDLKTLVGSNVGPVIIAMILYTSSICVFTYCLSFLFDNHASAQNVMLLIYILTGTILLVVNSVLSIIDSTRDINRHLKFIYRLVPNFCFGELIGNMMTRTSALAHGGQKGAWDMEISGYPLLFMAWETVVYLIILFVIEKVQASPEMLARFRVRERSEAKAKIAEFEAKQDAEGIVDDEDVIAEKERLLQLKNSGSEKEMISIEGMRKLYPGRFNTAPKLAVKNLYLGIPQGQCFGFLGINGAGKTTTLKILTGDELPTEGTGYLSQMDILTHQREIRRLIGYCPQFDALIETLTARQHLVLFARIKGVAEEDIPVLVNRLLNLLSLEEYADRPAGGYSGGNKRKLCVGIALIGNPPVVFLDEPSTGMDPGARRFMWNLISTTMKGRSVILTTHSMEECEALCGRIGIMVSGRLRCLGSAQHLKHRFGKGYQLELNCPADRIEQVKAFVGQQFPGARVLEHHDRNIKFNLPKGHMTLANIFRVINTNRAALSIAEYSVSEATLEQIFLHFAKQQDEETDKVEGVEDETQPLSPGLQSPGLQLQESKSSDTFINVVPYPDDHKVEIELSDR